MYWNNGDVIASIDTKRLTLTWDVLKCIKVFITGIDVIRLTLTWDVLKYGICNVKEFELLD